MKIKLFVFLSLLSATVFAFDGNFELSEDAQKQADFYNKFLQALSLEQEDKNQEAATILKELLTQNPDDKHIIHEYCYLALDNKKEDFNFCKNALENLKNKTWQNYTVLGDYYLREGALTQALAEYEKALKLNPENLDLAFHYAGILASRDQNAAVEYLKDLAKTYPQTDGFITVKIAEIYLKNNEEDKAISFLEDSLKTVQKKDGVYFTLVRFYEQKKDVKKLYSLYQAMYANGLADTNILEKLGALALLKDDEESAQKYFAELLKSDDTNPYATRFFALQEQSQGRYENALNYVKKSRDFENNPASQIKAGYYLSMLSKQDELLDLMENAYKKFPNNNQIAYYYALALRDGEKHNKALKVFEEILQSEPENELALLNYATLLHEQKKYKKMQETLRKLLKINPNSAEGLNFLGYFLVDEGKKTDLDEGYKLISKALSLKPDEIAYQDSLAWYYFKAGNVAEANKILSALPDVKDEEIYLHKAEVAYALKDFAGAVKNYESALKINPKNKVAKKGLKRAKRGI